MTDTDGAKSPDERSVEKKSQGLEYPDPPTSLFTVNKKEVGLARQDSTTWIFIRAFFLSSSHPMWELVLEFGQHARSTSCGKLEHVDGRK